MRRFPGRSGFISAMIVAATIVFSAPSSLAKGPESATVSGPGIARPIELDTSDAGLVGRAMGQTGLWWSRARDLPLPLEQAPDPLGPGYTLTWIRYGGPDESVDDRTIRQVIYPFAEGGVVIHTSIQAGLRHSPELVGWFEAPGLGDTLSELGIPVAGGTSWHEATPPEIVGERSSRRRPTGSFSLLAVACLCLVAVMAAALRLRSPIRGRRRSVVARVRYVWSPEERSHRSQRFTTRIPTRS